MARPPLAAAMSQHAGVLRDHEQLEHLRQMLGRTPSASTRLDLATVEATNLHAVSVLIAVAALARTESRGCHRWRDAPPVISAERARHTVVRVDAGQPWVAGAVRAGAGAVA